MPNRVCTVKGQDHRGHALSVHVEAGSMLEAAARGMDEISRSGGRPSELEITMHVPGTTWKIDPERLMKWVSKGKHIHLMNCHRDLDELFDMDVSTQVSIKIEDLANQVIHSYIFYLCVEETGGLRGILVASDRIRNQGLLEISAKDIINLFDLAAKGEDAISVTYNEKKGDYVVRLAKRPRNQKASSA